MTLHAGRRDSNNDGVLAPIGAARYEAEIDLEDDTTRAKVVRLVGLDKRVLELGCATGYMSRVLRERGCQVVGIELDEEAAATAALHCERMIIGDVERIDLDHELGNDRFDVIIAADVLEHLKDPLAVLVRVKRFLEPGGSVIASIPNVAHGSVRLALLTGHFPYSEVGLLDRTHLRFFTRQSVEQLFDDADLSITRLERQLVGIDWSEVTYDVAAVPRELPGTLSRDLEAITYQFIVVARESQGGEPSVDREVVDGPIAHHSTSLVEDVIVRDAEIGRLQQVLEEAVALRDTEIHRLQQAYEEAVALRDAEIHRLQQAQEEAVTLRDAEIRRLQQVLEEAVTRRDAEIHHLQEALENTPAARIKSIASRLKRVGSRPLSRS